MRIEISLYPFGTSRETLVVGQFINGQFVQDTVIRTALNDSRLSVKRKYRGQYGKPSSWQEVVIEVPEDYPLAIAKRYLTGQTTTETETEFKILYSGKEA